MGFINRYFNLLLLSSWIIGMLVPSVGTLTSLIVIVSLAFIIFCSFFQVDLSTRSLYADVNISLAFTLFRYILLPVLLYFAVNWFSSFYALILLITFLLPSAVSSPAFSMLFGGKMNLSLKVLIISSFISILSIPLILGLLLDSDVSVPVGSLLITLIYTIVVPFIVHLPLRKVRVVRETVIKFNSLFTLVGLAIIFIVVTAKNKEEIIGQPGLIGIYAIASFLIYILMYSIGFMYPSGRKDIRATFSISSGANNVGLGVTITTLFFPGNVNIFFIVSQITWVLILIPVRRWLRKL